MGGNENGIRVIRAQMPYPQINSKPNCKNKFMAYPKSVVKIVIFLVYNCFSFRETHKRPYTHYLG
jgi:hypothetical protein